MEHDIIIILNHQGRSIWEILVSTTHVFVCRGGQFQKSVCNISVKQQLNILDFELSPAHPYSNYPLPTPTQPISFTHPSVGLNVSSDPSQLVSVLW